MENKQTCTAQYQPRNQTPLAPDHRVLLIRNVSEHPRLYKNEFLRTPYLYRYEKQQMWDKIAQESGFEKTEDAKCKWRVLINYLRQHLENVAQRKTRRYIPTTKNPEDKYVQLNDWSFYSELEFIVPYVKYAASKQSNNGNRLEISPSEIDLIIEGIEVEVDRKNKQQQQKEKAENDFKIHLKTKEPEQQHNIKDNEKTVLDTEDNLTEDNKILKEYFENMLKSTSKLPRFHQNRIKQNLLDCINEQKALNKIN